MVFETEVHIPDTNKLQHLKLFLYILKASVVQ